MRKWKAEGAVWALALSPDGTLLASGGTDANVTLWDVAGGEKLRTLEGHRDPIMDVAFSPDGALLASASYDATARIWDVASGETRHVLRGHAGKVTGVAFAPDGNTLATGSSDTYVLLWDVASGYPITVLQGHTNHVYGLTFLKDGRLVSASRDRTLRVWDTESNVTLQVLQGHTGAVEWLATHADFLFSASNDGTVRRWKIGAMDTARPAGDEKPARFPTPRKFTTVPLKSEPFSTAIAPDGSAIAVGFMDGSLRVYTLPDVRLVWENTDAHDWAVVRLAFSPAGNLQALEDLETDGVYLVSASMDDTAKLWQVSDGALAQTFSGHEDGVHAVAFAPDGKTIATASYDGRIGLFEIGQEEGQFFQAHEGEDVNSVAFDTTGTKLVSIGDDNEVRLWDVTSWPPILLQDFQKPMDKGLWVDISPDGSRIVSVGRDNLVHILNADDGSEEHTLVGHENTVYRAAFSPDGGQVVTVGGGGTVRFWDLATQSQLFSLRLPEIGSAAGPWDFDFRCMANGDCWLAVPLTKGELVLYYMEGVYADKAPAE